MSEQDATARTGYRRGPNGYATKEPVSAFNPVNDPVMTVYVDEQVEGVRMVIMRGPVSVNAYLGVPLGHPLAGQSYDDMPLSVHGGLTFASTFEKLPGWYFYGWDHAHAGDKMLRSEEIVKLIGEDHGREWTVEQVTQEARDTLYEFRQLVRLSENVAMKAREDRVR